MKKILHLSNYFPPHIGGIEQTTQDIVNALKEQSIQKVICFGNCDKNIVIDNYDGVEVIRVPYFLKVSSQAISFKLKKILKKCLSEFKPDIIHIHLPNPLMVMYLNKCKYTGKIIIHHHLDIINQKILKLFVRRVNRKIYESSEKIIVTSENYKLHSDELRNYQDKIEIVYSTIDNNDLIVNNADIIEIDKIREKYKGKIIAFFIGRHVKYKGLEYLIEASKKLSKDHVFLIAGEGKLTEELKEQASGLDNVIFLGKLNNKEKRIYLHACDIFTFPSITKNEAFGLSLAEALYCGKPAITFNIEGSGVNFVNLKDITGLEMPVRDTDAYAKAIEKLSYDKELYKKLATNAIQRTDELFTISRFNQSIKKIYNQL